MNTDLKLYQSNGSPNSRRVRIFLAEKGVALTQVPVDLGAKEQFSDAYVAINPRRVVPTLVLEDGTAIGEVPAIMRYLDEAFPETPLLGSSPKEKALVQMWERRMELEGFAAVMETVRNRVAGLKDRAIAGSHDYAQIPALVDRGMERIRDFLCGPGSAAWRRGFRGGIGLLSGGHHYVRNDLVCDQRAPARHPGGERGDAPLVRRSGGPRKLLGLTAARNLRLRHATGRIPQGERRTRQIWVESGSAALDPYFVIVMQRDSLKRFGSIPWLTITSRSKSDWYPFSGSSTQSSRT
jgi:glutathione S-transferase